MQMSPQETAAEAESDWWALVQLAGDPAPLPFTALSARGSHSGCQRGRAWVKGCHPSLLLVAIRGEQLSFVGETGGVMKLGGNDV